MAFCDTFQTIVGGGREGDLDPAKWSFTRATQANNPEAGLVNNYLPFNAEFCTTHQMRLADNDSFICGEQFGESNHWMEGMADGGSYVLNSLRARQPFDFAGRTGNVVFDVDAKTEGSHSFWPEVWLTDEPVQGPHQDFPGTHLYPRNGIEFLFNADWCGGAPQSQNALRQIVVFNNYQPTDYDFQYSPCFTTQDDMANHFQLKISSTSIAVWASDAGGANFREIASVATPPLPLTRGYLSFEHAQYAADKFNSTDTMTYHWHALGFDGPVLPADRGYEVPDADQKQPDGSTNLGYQTPTATSRCRRSTSRAWPRRTSPTTCTGSRRPRRSSPPSTASTGRCPTRIRTGSRSARTSGATSSSRLRCRICIQGRTRWRSRTRAAAISARRSRTSTSNSSSTDARQRPRRSLYRLGAWTSSTRVTLGSITNAISRLSKATAGTGSTTTFPPFAHNSSIPRPRSGTKNASW